MGKPLRLLIVEDSEDDALLLVRQLQKYGYDVTFERVDTPVSLECALGKQWDIITSDFIMPQFSGLRALEIVRSKDKDLPFIIVSGKIGEDTAIAAMKAGAHDYLMKDNLKRLGAAVEQGLLEAENLRRRRIAEEALRDSEANLTQAQQIAHLGNWHYDAKTGSVHWSEELYRIFGLNPQQFVPSFDSIVNYVYEDDRESVRKSVEAAWRSQQPYDIEYRVVRPDGSERSIHAKADTVFDGSGEVAGMVGTVLDITDKRELRDNLQYYATRLIDAQEDEKKRIARELHDDAGQSLTSLCFQIDALLKNKLLPEEMKARLSQIRESCAGVLRKLRLLSHELRPEMLGQLGLEKALEQLVFELRSEGQIDAGFTSTGATRRLSPEAELALFRIAQEALNNVRKHSQAKKASVSLEFNPRSAQLIISDNGCGFKVPTKFNLSKTGTLGLISMEERARLIGASLTLESRAKQGTTVTVEVAE